MVFHEAPPSTTASVISKPLSGHKIFRFLDQETPVTETRNGAPSQ
jgi:hypothetical protein